MLGTGFAFHSKQINTKFIYNLQGKLETENFLLMTKLLISNVSLLCTDRDPKQSGLEEVVTCTRGRSGRVPLWPHCRQGNVAAAGAV